MVTHAQPNQFFRDEQERLQERSDVDVHEHPDSCSEAVAALDCRERNDWGVRALHARLRPQVKVGALIEIARKVMPQPVVV